MPGRAPRSPPARAPRAPRLQQPIEQGRAPAGERHPPKRERKGGEGPAEKQMRDGGERMGSAERSGEIKKEKEQLTCGSRGE